MSGGHYNYIQFELEKTIEQIQLDIGKIKNHNGTEEGFCQVFENPDRVVFDLSYLLSVLHLSKTYLHHLDYLISGDYSEETYKQRLEEDFIESGLDINLSNTP